MFEWIAGIGSSTLSQLSNLGRATLILIQAIIGRSNVGVHWRLTIDQVYVYFDNGRHQGIRYPSTCEHAAPLEPESDDDINP